MSKRVRVLFVRHGETADNARSVIQGHIDTPLNENGVIQSQIARDYLKKTRIDVCFTSDLQRAKRTAEIIMEPHAGAPMIVDARIKEKYLGALEGTVYYEAQTPEARATIEPSHIFIARLLSFYDALFPKLSIDSTLLPPSVNYKSEITILVVSHGGPIKVILPALVKSRGITWATTAKVRADQLKMKVWNCSISELIMENTPSAQGQSSQWSGTITKFVDVKHFEEAGEALKEGTEADAALTKTEQAKVGQPMEWWKEANGSSQPPAVNP